MPSEFEQDWSDGPTDTLLEKFGESVSYTPRGGAATTITAVIVRRPLQVVDEMHGPVIEYARSAWISRSDAPTLNINGDALSCRARIEDAANSAFRLSALLNQAAGMWHVSLTSL